MKPWNATLIRSGALAVLVAGCSSGANLPGANTSAGAGGMEATAAAASGGMPAAPSGSGGSLATAGQVADTKAGSGGAGTRASSAGSGGKDSAGSAAGAGGGGGGASGEAGASGSSAGDSAAGAAGTNPAPEAGTCETLPAVTDYAAAGPFGDAKMFANTGPSNNYTMYRPDASLGKDGFKHPIATWGNGIATTPDEYQKLLTLVASHGFVIIACNDTQAERACLNTGMDWLVMQDTESGPLQGKLDVTREVTIGYSWGGGAAIDTSNRPNVKATLSLHGMPPREMTAWDDMHAPLMLTTSTGDNFVTASGYVTPNYEKSKVQTFYGTLDDSNAGHLYIADQSASICIGAALGSTFGSCGDAKDEQGPAVAWLRLWACGDENAKSYFYGDDCKLCQKPWTNPQRKNWP